MTQIARNLTDDGDGFLVGKEYLIHDRDPLFTQEFQETLAAAGVKTVRLPPRSPNLNAHAERFVRSIKESCLDRMILFGERSLRRAVQARISDLELRLEHGTPSLLLKATTLPCKAGHDGIEGFPWPVLVVR